MKIRRLAEDFEVTEVANVVLTGGPQACYRLQKRGIGTPEAIDQILRKWGLQRRAISYGGLKDRHAITNQYVTIRNGPRKNLRLQHLHLEYLGQSPQPFGPGDIQGNRFRLVLRSMNSSSVEAALTAVADARRTGIPNYFDEQRFGSVTAEGEFIAAAWMKGDYERTLWLTFAAPSRFDRPADREQKEILRQHWGDWAFCKAALARSHRRSIITFLADRPGDFRGAWGRVRQDLRSLYLSAFQSYLWNQLLIAALRSTCPAESLREVPSRLGPLPFFHDLPSAQWLQLRELQLPLPTARQKLEPGPSQELVDRVLGELGWTLRELRVKYPRDSFLSKGWRAAVVPLPEIAAVSEADELDPGKLKLVLQFQLPRGSYATILVKRITAAARPGTAPALEEGDLTEHEADVDGEYAGLDDFDE